VLAPVAGQVVRRSVHPGSRVQPGTPLLAVVPLERLWVDANFKEGQLAGIKPGLPVELTADAYGDEVVFHGRVLGLAAGTGGAFALLPPQNASGNWIKIVQRVPVRIALDPAELVLHPLRIGLSMDVRVRLDADPQAVAAPPPRSTATVAAPADTESRIAAIIAANAGGSAKP
jgi:membrane fusion protein (multidrug efflux system)